MRQLRDIGPPTQPPLSLREPDTPGPIRVWHADQGEEPEGETFYEAISAGRPVSVVAPDLADSAYRVFLAAAASLAVLVVLGLTGLQLFGSRDVAGNAQPAKATNQTSQPVVSQSQTDQGAAAPASEASGAGGAFGTGTSSGSAPGRGAGANVTSSSGGASTGGGSGGGTDPCLGIPLLPGQTCVIVNGLPQLVPPTP